MDNDTPSLAAITEVAPGVLFSDLDILVTPALDLAIVFSCLTSALVHSRRTIFFALAIFYSGLCKAGLVRQDNGNRMTKRCACAIKRVGDWPMVRL